MVWRILESMVSLGALGLAGYSIRHGADPFNALLFAALIISGPKVAEWWLVREDYVNYEEVRDQRQGDD